MAQRLLIATIKLQTIPLVGRVISWMGFVFVIVEKKDPRVKAMHLNPVPDNEAVFFEDTNEVVALDKDEYKQRYSDRWAEIAEKYPDINK